MEVTIDASVFEGMPPPLVEKLIGLWKTNVQECMGACDVTESFAGPRRAIAWLDDGFSALDSFLSLFVSFLAPRFLPFSRRVVTQMRRVPSVVAAL